MNILEAYDEVWLSLKNLAMEGVKFTVTPSHSREIEDTVKTYRNKPDSLPVQLWSHIEFSVKSEYDKDALRREQVRLSAQNIAFDTGGGAGTRDWELDWSLFIASDEDIDDMEVGRGMVQDVIDSMESVQND